MVVTRQGKCQCDAGDANGWTLCNSCADLAFRVYKKSVDFPDGVWYKIIRLRGDAGWEFRSLRQLEFSFSES